MKPNKKLKAYMDSHPFCEACGTRVSEKALPHHIKSRGAGGSDEPENLLRLCFVCHYGIVHGLPGHRGLIERYPEVYDKIASIKTRME